MADVLGGAMVFRDHALPAEQDLRERINEGLPYRSFESVRERLGLSIPDAAAVLHMPIRTMARRRKLRKLSPDESDRLYRVARVAAQAVEVFGDEARATTWLQRPNRAMNGERPIRMLDTDVGARYVEDVLGRIEAGTVG